MPQGVTAAAMQTREEVRPAPAVSRVYEVNGYRLSRQIVGTCETALADEGSISASGYVDGVKKDSLRLNRVVLVDGARRVIGSAPIHGNAWTLTASTTALAKDSGSASAEIFAVGPEERILYGILDKASFSSNFEQFAQFSADVELPSFKKELRELITKAVATRYTSTSIHNAITTGNSYQSLFLDDGRKTSGREDREQYLRLVDLNGKSLIDIGSNMGEMSRLARYLGAKSVDSFEYDSFFVETARAVNCLNGITGVSLYQADVTQPGFFKDRQYDAILALNVWVYIEREFADFPAMAPLVLFETHTLDHGLKYYYDRLIAHYPFATCLSLSDFGNDPAKTRAFLALATSEEALEGFVRQDKIKVEPYFANRFLEKVGVLDERGVRQLAGHCYSDVGAELPSAKADFSFGSDRYFKTLLAGFHQYWMEGQRLSSNNIYAEYLRQGIESGVIDQQLKHVASDDNLFLRKVANKFEDFESIVSGSPAHVPPILLYSDNNGDFKFEDTSGKRIACRDIDGHHRFFACQLMGVREIHYRLL